MDIDEILLNAEEKMTKAVAALHRDFGKLRTGRASTALVDSIKADYYGTPTPICQMASVTVPDSRTITIQPWDKSGFSAVEKAILKSDLGLTPTKDGEDRRKELVKVGRKYAEESRVAVRNVRREANEALKKLEKDKTITEDERKKAEADVQDLTNKYVGNVDKAFEAKEQEILAI